MSGDFRDLPSLQVRSDLGVLRITIDRPQVRNALTDEVVRDLGRLAEQLEHRRDIRVIVLRGSDGNFCAGGDIHGFRRLAAETAQASEDGDALAAYNQAFGEVLLRWHALPQVTIALIEGAARGGGIGLACAFDLVLATRSASFALSEARIGVIPAQIAPFLVMRVGLAAARFAALTGRSFDGSAAQAMGLVDQLLDDTVALEAASEALIRDVLRCGPDALATTKSLLLRVGSEPVASLMRDAATLFASAARGAEGREGIAAFIEKRTPAWAVYPPEKG